MRPEAELSVIHLTDHCPNSDAWHCHLTTCSVLTSGNDMEDTGAIVCAAHRPDLRSLEIVHSRNSTTSGIRNGRRNCFGPGCGPSRQIHHQHLLHTSLPATCGTSLWMCLIHREHVMVKSACTGDDILSSLALSSQRAGSAQYDVCSQHDGHGHAPCRDG